MTTWNLKINPFEFKIICDTGKILKMAVMHPVQTLSVLQEQKKTRKMQSTAPNEPNLSTLVLPE